MRRINSGNSLPSIRAMFCFWRDARTSLGLMSVAGFRRLAMGDGIAKHLAGGLEGTLGQIIDAASLDGLEHGDQFGRLDF
jgi:hypothetical protein